MKIPKLFILILAIFVTVTSISMTAVAAWDRGGTLLDKLLIILLSIVIVLAVHLLPAISRRPLTWLLWVGCLACSIYGHLTFLTHASLRAGELIAKQSAVNVGIDNQIETVKSALKQIKARPVTEIAAQLAQTTLKRERVALREELSEGKKAEALRNELIRLSQLSTTAKISGAIDPVTAKFSQFLGWSEVVISVAVGLTFSILVELIGALFWYEALRPADNNAGERAAVTVAMTQDAEITQNITGVTPGITGDLTDHVTHSNADDNSPVNHPPVESENVAETEQDVLISKLKIAIKTGQCKATVAGIRQFVKCSQSRAQELRRQIA